MPFAAHASEQPAPASSDAPGANTEQPAEKRLVLRVEGPLSSEREEALANLVRSELAANAASLTLERSGLPTLDWIQRARADRSALVIAVLDVRGENWELTIVDAARGRATVRRLPGRVETNAALLEAVAAILATAVAAVAEGLEVASESLESVVPGADVPKATETPPSETFAPDERERAFVAFRGGVFANLSSFADQASLGLLTSVGLRFGGEVDVRALAAFAAPVTLETFLGDFDLGRLSIGGSLGWAQKLGPLEAEPELGASFELVRRSGASPVPGVGSSADSEFWRVGPTFGLRLSYPLLGWAALELAGGLGYFPREVAFVAAGEPPYVLAELEKTEFSLNLGFELFAPE
jgi:hypothetical protein